jgi:EmrB/QacA subfamily drug resistance transporter
MASDRRMWWILSVTSLGALLSALNFSTLIIALPDLIRSLHASLLQAVWVMLAYMVAQTIMVLMAGSLADLFGRKRLYILGMALFTIVSFAAGNVHSAPVLIVLRVIQGMGGAMVMANSTAIVADAFPRQKLGMALGINIMVVAVGQIIGPVLGGWLTTDFGWQWTFLFNVPFGVLAVVWGLWVMGFSDRGAAEERRIDVWGVLTYVVMLAGLLFALTWGPVQSWESPVVWIGAGAFVVFLPLWIWIEKHHPQPLMHLPLFRNRMFAVGVLSATLSAIGRMAMVFLLIFYFQGARGYDALMAGILSIPLAAGMLVVSPLSGWIADRIGAMIPATAGMFLSMVGMAGLAVDIGLTTPYWRLAVWMLIAGIGTGLFNSPNSSNIMNAAGPRYRGEASGIRSLTTNTGMMMSVAFSLALVTSSIPRQAMLAIFAGTEVGVHGSAASLEGFIAGLHTAFWAMTALLAIATVISGLRGSSSSGEAEPESRQLVGESR